MAILYVAACLLVVTSVSPAARAPYTRTLYVTATDSSGEPLTDLTAADFSVKEGGKERTIDKVEPASERMHLSVLVQERLGGIQGVPSGIAKLIQPLLSQADVQIISVGLRNFMVVDYTSDTNAIVKGLNSLATNNPRAHDEHIVDGIYDLSRQIQQKQLSRPAIVVIAISGLQVTSTSADQALTGLRQSGAVMYAATLDGGESTSGTAGQQLGMLSEGSDLDRVLGDGPKQSGGERKEITGNEATGFEGLLAGFAKDLSHQYAISYTLPDGVKMNSTVQITLKRKGATLHAPTRIPDK